MDGGSSRGGRRGASDPAPSDRPDTADAAGILDVVKDAFSYDGTRDAERGARHRAGHLVGPAHGRSLIELVADEGGTVVGHLQAAPGSPRGDANTHGPASRPSAWAPSNQGQRHRSAHSWWR